MSTHRPIHGLFYGFVGAKKSTAAASFPTPICVDLFDSMGMESPYIDGRVIEATSKVEDDETKSGVPITRVLDSKRKLLCQVNYWHDDDPEDPDCWRLFKDDFKTRDFSKWSTVVCDSLTMMTEAAFNRAKYKINPTVKHPKIWHGGATDEMVWVKNRLAGIRINVILIAHIAKKFAIVDADANTGRPEKKIDKRVESAEEDDEGNMTLLRSIAAPGRLGNTEALTSQFSEVWRFYVVRDASGRCRWEIQTQPSGNDYTAKTQIMAPNGLVIARELKDGEIEDINTYEAVWEKKKGGK